mgnify:CR=1 FL=1
MDKQRQQIIEAGLERAAEVLGDVTEPVMAEFYRRYPDARASFQHHSPHNPASLEALETLRIAIAELESMIAAGAQPIDKAPRPGRRGSEQWLRNGAPMAGATSKTLSFAAVRASDAGVYTVALINAGTEPFPGEAHLAEKLAELVPAGTVERRGRTVESASNAAPERHHHRASPVIGALAAVLGNAAAKLGELNHQRVVQQTLILQVVVEGQVDVDRLVGRAVERAGSAGSRAAPGPAPPAPAAPWPGS